MLPVCGLSYSSLTSLLSPGSCHFSGSWEGFRAQGLKAMGACCCVGSVDSGSCGVQSRSCVCA